jgi:maleylpyruvate isomerase
MLGRVAAALGRRDDAPRMRLLATDAPTDSGALHTVGEVPPGGPLVEGTQNALLAWLTGRSSGADLTVRGGGDRHVGEGCEGGGGVWLPVVPKLS